LVAIIICVLAQWRVTVLWLRQSRRRFSVGALAHNPGVFFLRLRKV